MLDLTAINALVAQHGSVARVVVAEVKGSAPREVGAAMIVWADGFDGTIGGGTLEFEAIKHARQMLQQDRSATVSRHPLGPALGQCCGGAVTLVSEVFDQAIPNPNAPFFLRRVEGNAEQPLSLKRAQSALRSKGTLPQTQLDHGWFLEPLQRQRTPLWIWGAGHVGRAMVHTIHPLPDFDITWIDTAQDRFPAHIPNTVSPLIASNPADLVQHIPSAAQHLILTYSHALDLDLCHQLIQTDAAFIGLIGSRSKWVRFQRRLANLGHGTAQISRITCPIGDPRFGKHPQAIAISVASQLMDAKQEKSARRDRTA